MAEQSIPAAGHPAADQSEGGWRHWLVLLLLLGLVALVATLAPLLLCEHPLLVTALLAPTSIFCLVLFVGLASLPRAGRGIFWYFFTFEALKTVGILSFCLDWPYPELSSGLALLTATIQAVWTVIFVSWLHTTQAPGAAPGVRPGSFGRPGPREMLHSAIGLLRALNLEIAGFISAFLYMTYFLTFALAFHDRAQAARGADEQGRPCRALHVASVDTSACSSVTEGESSQQSATAVRQPGAHPAEEGPDLGTECQSRPLTLWFKRGSAAFDACEVKALEQLAKEELRNHRTIANAVYDLMGPAFLQAHCQAAPRITPENLATLICFQRRVRDEGPYKSLQVRLVGHASKEAPDREVFPSNYELSEARVQASHMLLSDLVVSAVQQPYELEVEWVHVPRSSDADPFPPDPPKGLGDHDPSLRVDITLSALPDRLKQKQVEALLGPPASLELLDYLYFMIYTITTTGYGDMQPVTPLAKFICSVANLFEVLFLVILFNVLLGNSRADRKAEEKASAAAAP